MKFDHPFPSRALRRWQQRSGGLHPTEIAVAAEDAGFDLVSSSATATPARRGSPLSRPPR